MSCPSCLPFLTWASPPSMAARRVSYVTVELIGFPPSPSVCSASGLPPKVSQIHPAPLSDGKSCVPISSSLILMGLERRCWDPSRFLSRSAMVMSRIHSRLGDIVTWPGMPAISQVVWCPPMARSCGERTRKKRNNSAGSASEIPFKQTRPASLVAAAIRFRLWWQRASALNIRDKSPLIGRGSGRKYISEQSTLLHGSHRMSTRHSGIAQASIPHRLRKDLRVCPLPVASTRSRTFMIFESCRIRFHRSASHYPPRLAHVWSQPRQVQPWEACHVCDP